MIITAGNNNGVQQISHYIEGIVSAEGESLQFVRGGIGIGVDDRIRKAYETLVKDYEPGDEIYLIGFSRGAFEARSLGGLITLFGVGKAGACSPCSCRPPANRHTASIFKRATSAAWYQMLFALPRCHFAALSPFTSRLGATAVVPKSLSFLGPSKFIPEALYRRQPKASRNISGCHVRAVRGNTQRGAVRIRCPSRPTRRQAGVVAGDRFAVGIFLMGSWA
jgi:hypothetical protein